MSKANEILSGEDISNNTVTDMLNENVDTNVLLFRGPSHKGVRDLTRRLNPRIGYKCTK